MSERIIEIGTIVEDYYDCEDSEKVGELKAHWESIAPRGRHLRWQVVANPPVPEPPPEQIRVQEIDARLAEIDRESSRPLRAIISETATDYDREKLATLEAEAEALREERRGLVNAK